MSGSAANIQVDCPGCGKRFTVAAQHAGKRGKCKSCGAELKVPHPPPDESSVAQEDDLYDLAPDEQPAKRPQTAVQSAEPQAVSAPVLAYSGPSPKRTGRDDRAERFDPSDPFEGNKFRNLYLPLILIGGTALFTILSDAVFTHNAAVGIAGASLKMIVKLAVEIPVMLIACLLAVKLLDAAFGPLGPALLKLSAIALAPDAVSSLIVFVAFIISHASGNPLNVAVDVGIAAVIGWLLSLIVYFWLFMYFFELDLGEAYRLIIFVWFVRMALVWLVMMTVLSLVFSR